MRPAIDFACTSGEQCQNGYCHGSSDNKCCNNASECDDGNPCTEDSCIGNGRCKNEAGQADGNACDDQNACTRNDVCADRQCIGGDPVVCTALDQCHDPGVCDPLTGVIDGSRTTRAVKRALSASSMFSRLVGTPILPSGNALKAME